jgi:glycoside/pentoside/hexuronide:cation symporter, GPH family
MHYGIKILYGVGDVANAIKMVLFGLFTLFFYTTVMGLPGAWVGIASAIGLLWDAIIDPYIGYCSDRARFRFGRRHTFMLVGALTMGASFWAFFSPFQDLPAAALFAWLLVSGLLVRTTTSFYTVPYYAVGAELSHDYHERTLVTGLRGILALIGTLAAAPLSLVVFFPDRTPGVDPKLNAAGYSVMGLAFGLVMTIAGLTATLGTLSWRSHLPTGNGAEAAQTPRSFFMSIVQSLRNPSFRVLLISFSLSFLALVINSALSLHYLTYYVKIASSTALSTFQFVLYVGGVVGVVFWLWVSKIIEKHLLYLIATVVTAVLMLGALLLLGEGHLLGTGNVRPLIIGHGLAGFFSSILWFIPQSMIADVADEDELVTGRRREGSFFGIFFFGQQVAAGVSSLVAGVLLDWFAGLVPAQAQQSALTIYRIAVLYSALPAALLLIAGVLILRYSLTRQQVVWLQAELERWRMTQHLSDSTGLSGKISSH